MSDFAHLADRFKSKLGLRSDTPSGNQSYGRPNPSYESRPSYPGSSYGGPPPIPPRPGQSPPQASASPQEREAGPHGNPQAGAVYAPGTYPTPELLKYPLQKSRTIHPSNGNIQQALDELGPSSTLYLAPRSVWSIHTPIVLHPYQELATEGYPTAHEDMAVLDAEEDCRPHVIHAFGKSGIRLRNLVVEGNKEKHGWDKDGGVMIQLGGGDTVNQVLDRCVLRNPRHWSAVQSFEGASNTRITNNVIGPAGVGWDIEQSRWADGISYASSDGLIAGNLVQDTTDGAIVLFNAPGTLVTDNTIVTRTRLSLGAINMVDHGVHDGNYGFTRVVQNTIITAGTMIKIGIGQGCSVWGMQGERKVIRGGIVLRNLVTRDLNYVYGPVKPGTPPQLGEGTIGYAFPIGADVKEWTCRDNVSQDNVVHSGDISSTLPSFLNASPGPFIHDSYGHSEGDEADVASLDLQKEFVEGKVWGLLMVRPGESTVLSHHGGGLRMRLGERRRLRGTEFVFREDGEFLIYRVDEHGRGGQVLWQAGSAGRLDQRRPGVSDAELRFTESGKLIIVHERDVLWDFTPHITWDAPPRSRRPNFPRLVFSAEAPHLSITSADGNTLFGSSYTFPRMPEFAVGKFVSRPTPQSGGGALVYSLSPQRQFVVAHTHSIVDSIRWPLDPNRFHVVCSVGDGQTEGIDDKDVKLLFQGDGNLVIYAGDGHPTWASNTSAHKMQFGLGTEQEPFLELLDENNERVWRNP